MPHSSETFVPWLKDRMEAGQFRAVIDREYPFERIVDAYRYVESEQKVGIVVINVMPAGSQSMTEEVAHEGDCI
jgi:NADPH:quinone reductase-like Zn-dependent oxidoreductase